ncbi:unnamed protein product [Paramecium pentaurelia]|uniref:Glycoside hydrolase family 38 central domain-containing protein n=1 Tax=Paramecium pentaurelia TaxID=43138 RepID=A0A8S1TLU7_9CILI|nr:unnamed protein product [Paramecium pentaurelia]
MNFWCFLMLILLQQSYSRFFGLTNKLGSQKLKVILLPHSHDDVGWLDTVDQIYLSGPGVKNIISSYINALLENEDRKFVQVEIVYFERWWNEQSVLMQQKVKGLVENGQLSFAAGGLVMNDEATPYYEDIIDQITYGHEFLFKTFNVIPRVGWQIDPFGHSNAQSILSYLFGMEASFYARIDYQDKEYRQKNKELEMIHIPYTTSKQHYPILIHVNYFHYSSPPRFDFDPLRNSGGYVNDQNVQSKADDLNQYFVRQGQYYRGQVLTHTLGDDNEWSNSKSYYENMEKVVNYINSHPDKYNIVIKFGTPQDYIEEINEYSDEIFYPTKNDDFFPYADKQHCYWTGYFTSKIAFKGFVRYTGRYFQQLKTFISYSFASHNQDILDLKQPLLKALKELGYTLGVSQHHDAVTGTSKEHVTKDYVKMLHRDLTKMNKEFHRLMKIVIQKDLNEKNIDELYQYTYNSTSSECVEIYENLQNNKTILLTIVDTKINENDQDIIKIKVPKLPLNIIDIQNKLVQGDVICSNSKDEQDCTLYFNYNIKKGVQYYKIKQGNNNQESSAKIITSETFTNITANTKIQLDDGPEFQLQYKYYIASTDNVQPSGAYIFRPQGGAQVYGSIQNVKVFNGTILTELNIERSNVNTWIRKYKILNSQYEVETFIDSIQKEQNKGKEVIVIFKSDNIKNQKVFYTDSNGMDLQQRKIGYRETWSLQTNEFVAENYYPINGIIQIKDHASHNVMAVINDRSQGGSSFNDGEIEIMIHRRMYQDDRRGVAEALNEEEDNPQCKDQIQQNCQRIVGLRQKIIHKLLFFDQEHQPNLARKAQLYLDFQPIKIFAIDSQDQFNENLQIQQFQSLLDKIEVFNPKGEAIIKFYLIPREENNEYLLRIHNMQEQNNVKISFPDDISTEETILSGLRQWSEQQKIRLVWSKNQIQDTIYIPLDEVAPQQIKTFVIKI